VSTTEAFLCRADEHDKSTRRSSGLQHHNADEEDHVSKKNWYHAAGILWARLADLAVERRTETYSQVAPLIDTNPLSVRHALDLIQRYCLDQRLPPLTALVVSQQDGLPGDGFIAWDVDDLQSANDAIFAYPWKALANPFAGFGVNDTPESLAVVLLKNPASSADVYATVKVRGTAQMVFRSALLNAYGSRCAFCGLTFPQALEAAHIIPWSKATPAQRIDPRNGILLCSTHHRLFDDALITLSRSGKVVYWDPSMNDGDYSKADATMSASLHGSPALLPSIAEHRPSAEYLEIHYQDAGWLDEPAIDRS
jgi:putative restriction endonuclease